MKQHHETLRRKQVSYSVSRNLTPEQLKVWAQVYITEVDRGTDALAAGAMADKAARGGMTQ